jgi:hypothetical protein
MNNVAHFNIGFFSDLFSAISYMINYFIKKDTTVVKVTTNDEKIMYHWLSKCLVLELISGILCIVGCIELLVNNGREFGFMGSIFLYNFFLCFFGQRLAKDYDGARTIVIYFILAVWPFTG